MQIKNAIEIAMKAEELGAKFYAQLAKKFENNAELNATLEQLARDEVDHKKQFAALLDVEPGENINISDEHFDFLKQIDISRHFDYMQNVADVKEEEVLKNAYEFEKESVMFYHGIKDIVGDSKELDEIIKMEKQHMTQLLKYIITDAEFRGISDKWE
jgi:rubrerythrin